MITGRQYVLRGETVTVDVQWRQQRKTERLDGGPLLNLGTYTPRNVMIRRPDGTCDVRPFRGMRKAVA